MCCNSYIFGVPDLGAICIHDEKLLVAFAWGKTDLLYPTAMCWYSPENIHFLLHFTSIIQFVLVSIFNKWVPHHQTMPIHVKLLPGQTCFEVPEIQIAVYIPKNQGVPFPGNAGDAAHAALQHKGRQPELALFTTIKHNHANQVTFRQRWQDRKFYESLCLFPKRSWIILKGL